MIQFIMLYIKLTRSVKKLNWTGVITEPRLYSLIADIDILHCCVKNITCANILIIILLKLTYLY